MLHIKSSTAAIGLAVDSASTVEPLAPRATPLDNSLAAVGKVHHESSNTREQRHAATRSRDDVHSAAQPVRSLHAGPQARTSTVVVPDGHRIQRDQHVDTTMPATRPPAPTIALIMIPLCLSVLLSALDLTIVTLAIPTIVTSFQSTSGYVWIGGGFILASTAATPVWGSLADIWGRKPIILTALSLFLAGSLLCALAPHMDALVVGRVVQGLGASGMGTMVNVIICDTFSLRDRGLYLAVTSVVWAVGSAVGPVIGGTFTTRLE
jgi:hypothetical protein